MHFDDEITIDAPADHVWRTYTDVASWPAWTASVTAVTAEDDGPLASGARFRITQPKLPPATWEITELEPGRSWTWVARGPGVRTTASHLVEPVGADRAHVRLALQQAGPMGWLIGRLTARLTRQYLAMEAAGLKARCETAPPA